MTKYIETTITMRDGTELHQATTGRVTIKFPNGDVEYVLGNGVKLDRNTAKAFLSVRCV